MVVKPESEIRQTYKVEKFVFLIPPVSHERGAATHPVLKYYQKRVLFHYAHPW